MRLLHTMLRVGNLQRSIGFYTQVLGMTLLRKSENPEYKYSLAFVGYEGGNPGQAEIELTWNWDTDSYDMGTAYGHIAIGVEDVYATCERIRARGGQDHSRRTGGGTNRDRAHDETLHLLEFSQRLGAAPNARCA